MQELLPLHDKEGNVNRQLMSYARLYEDEIVEYFDLRKSELGKYLECIEVSLSTPIRELNIAIVRWIVKKILRNPEAFEDLDCEMQHNYHNVYSDMHLMNVLDPTVASSFIKFFLCPAPPLPMRRRTPAQIVNDEDEDKVVKEAKNDEEEKEDEEDDENGRGDMTETPKANPNAHTVLDKVAVCFEPEYALSNLKNTFGDLFASTADPKQKEQEHAAIRDTRPWARLVLRLLPYQSIQKTLSGKADLEERFPSFQFNLADALSHDAYNRAALIYFMPNYRGKIEQRDAARRERVPRGEKLDAVKDNEVCKTCRPVSDYEHKRGITNTLLEAPKLQLVLRNYQKELSESAVDGLNSVVVAPTGSGKTIVATHIMMMHAKKMIAQKKPYRMIFVVPTTPLVLQQSTKFFDYMGHICHVEQIHGGIEFSEGNRIEKFLACEIIVITPQCLINLLESIRLAERLYVSDMTLLILDECHHVGSSSDHPYSELTKTLYDWPYDKPQVVGLSASLGVGKDGTLKAESAIHHIKSLCAKLNAESICTVRKYADELLEFVQPPMDEIIDARRPSEDAALFTRKVKELMMEIRNSVHEDLKVLFMKGKTMGVTIDKRLLEWHTASMNATHAFNARLDLIKEEILHLTDSQMKSKLHRELKYLKVYSMALATNDLLPAPIALDQLRKDMMAIYNNNPSSEWAKKFFEKLSELEKLSTTNAEEDKDMTQKLRMLVREQFKRDKDSRVIIFVATRELAEQVSALLDAYRENEQGFMPEGTKCGFIISTKQKPGTETGQQNQNEQINVLKGFRDGSIPVIAATSVAEEGLDVAQCNLIIKYNTTGGVISRRQQRGRARAKDSRCVLLVMSDSVRARELGNLQAERMMDRCVGDIYKEGMDKFRIDVKKLQEQQKQERDKEEAEREHTRKLLMGHAYMIKCHTCATELCRSEDMRVGTAHYVSVDPRIWEKVIVKDEEAKSKYIDQVTQVIGKMYCSFCKDTLLGKVICYHGGFLPQLSCSELQFINLDRDKMNHDSNSRPKKWKVVASELFYIDDLRMTDIIMMQDEMKDESIVSKGLEMYNTFMEIKSRLSKKAKRNEDRRKLEDAKRNRNNANMSHESWSDVEP